MDEKGKPYKTAGKIDYVAGWYFKASQYMQGTAVRTALVSTNSITQGEQVTGVWKPPAKPYIKKLVGSVEFINNKKRWCLWLMGVSPVTLRKMPLVMDRIEKCREDRLASPEVQSVRRL